MLYRNLLYVGNATWKCFPIPMEGRVAKQQPHSDMTDQLSICHVPILEQPAPVKICQSHLIAGLGHPQLSQPDAFAADMQASTFH